MGYPSDLVTTNEPQRPVHNALFPVRLAYNTLSKTRCSYGGMPIVSSNFSDLTRPSGRLVPPQRGRSVLSWGLLFLCFEGFDILARPVQMHYYFKWYASAMDALAVDAITNPDASILYLCTPASAQALHKKSSDVQMLILTDETDYPTWFANEPCPAAIVNTHGKDYELVSRLQTTFSNLLMWEDELERLTFSSNPLGPILDCGARVLDEFICITDSGFNLTARTSEIDPPHPSVYDHLVDKGCYDLDTIKSIEATLPKRIERHWSYNEESKTIDGVPTYQFPIFFRGIYYFHLTMACSGEVDRAVMDSLFSIFAEKVENACTHLLGHILDVESPWHRVLANYIDKRPMDEDYVSNQLSRTSIPESAQFRLLSLDVPLDASPMMMNKLIEDVRKLNSGNCYPFAYNSQLIVLCYSITSEEIRLGTERCAHDYAKLVYEAHNAIRGGYSRIFDNITDIGDAYNQARLAINFSPFLDEEYELAGMNLKNSCYFFEYLSDYYNITVAFAHSEVARFSVEHNLVEWLSRSDEENNTDIVKLLWTYLSLDRNATAVSKQMHVHRNTVLYHINKVEKRFGVSVDSSFIRNKLQGDYKLYFLTNHFTKPIDCYHLLHVESDNSEPVSL